MHFSRNPSELIFSDQITHAQFRIWSAFALYADRHGFTWVRISDVSKRLKMDRKNLEKQLRKLVSLGLVERVDGGFVLPPLRSDWDESCMLNGVVNTPKRGGENPMDSDDEMGSLEPHHGVVRTPSWGSENPIPIKNNKPIPNQKSDQPPVVPQGTNELFELRAPIDDEPSLDSQFEDWWQAWCPNKRVSKKDARAEYAKALKKPGVTAEKLKRAAMAYAAQQANTPADKIKHPHRWLKDERYNDEPAQQPQCGPPERTGGGSSFDELRASLAHAVVEGSPERRAEPAGPGRGAIIVGAS